MKTDSRALRPVQLLAPLAFATLLAAAIAPAMAQKKPAAPKPAPPAAGAKAVLQDRVQAVVDEDPILASDVERVVKLGLEKPNPGEADAQFRRRVLDGLIDQRLQFHEIDRFNFQQAPVDDIQKRVAEIRARYPDDAAFQRALKEVGLDVKSLRQLVARQLLVLTYVDERLGSRVFVGPDDINRYYREVLTPEMQKRGQPVPPLADVREDIREVLKQQKMTQEMTTWTQELRTRADVVVYPAGNQPLPPVVRTIQEKKAETAKKPAAKASGTNPPATKPPGAP
jgi:peptidyl-prolyl cis-trans isomerase SurA